MNRMKGKGMAALLLSGAIFLSGCGGGAAKPAETKTAAAATATATATAAPVEEGTTGDLKLPAPNGHGTVVVDPTDMSLNPEAAKARKDTLIIGSQDYSGKFMECFRETAYDRYTAQVVEGIPVGTSHDGLPEPSGLLTWEASPDNLTITYKLKDGVKYSDGTPATAKDMEFFFLILADPTYDGDSDIEKFNIVGLKDYKEGNATSISGIKVIDDKTLSITLEQIFAPAVGSLGPVPMAKHYYDPDFKKGDLSKIKAKLEKPMGAGPYKIVEYKQGEAIIMKANEHYFMGKPKIENLIFKVVASATANQEVISGAVDMINYDVTEDGVKEMMENGFIRQMYYPNNGYGYVAMVQKFDEWKDVRVRQAFAHMIDRQGLVKQIYGPFGQVINVPESPVSWAYPKDVKVDEYNYDLAKAASLLEEAGYKKNDKGFYAKDGKELEIRFSAMPEHVILDVMIPQITEAAAKVGVKFSPEYLEWTALQAKTQKEELSTYFMAWGLTADPESGSNVYRTGGPQNKYAYSNKEVDKLFVDAVRTLDTKERAKIYGEIYQKINHDLPLLTIYQRSNGFAINGRVKGFDLSPFVDFTEQIAQLSLAE